MSALRQHQLESPRAVVVGDEGNINTLLHVSASVPILQSKTIYEHNDYVEVSGGGGLDGGEHMPASSCQSHVLLCHLLLVAPFQQSPRG